MIMSDLSGILSNNIKSPSPEWYMTFWGMTICPLNYIKLTSDIVTELDVITELDLITDFLKGSIEYWRPVRQTNRGRFLLWTPGPDPFGACMCSYVETSLCRTSQVSELWIPKIT